MKFPERINPDKLVPIYFNILIQEISYVKDIHIIIGKTTRFCDNFYSKFKHTFGNSENNMNKMIEFIFDQL